MPSRARLGQQFGDQLVAFVGRLVFEKRRGFGISRNAAVQIKIDATKELGVARRSRGRDALLLPTGLDALVDAISQPRLRLGRRSGQQNKKGG